MKLKHLRRRIRLLYEDEALRIAGIGPLVATGWFGTRLFSRRRTGGTLVASFTGIGAGMDVVQAEEFAGMASRKDRSVVFVTDKQRSWYNAPGLYERVIAELQPHIRDAGRVVTLGNSMGGFGALLFAAPLGARIALAFAPQASISGRIIPSETRWRKFIRAIDHIRFEHVGDHMDEERAYFVVHGGGGDDIQQIEAFRPSGALHHYVVPGGRHNIAAELKAAGQLSPLIEAAMAGDPVSFDALARAAGAQPPGSVSP
jgi:hypothetical protein